MKLEKQVRLTDIIAIAARQWHIAERLITSKSRVRDIVLVRAAIVAVARSMPVPPSYTTIGKALGCRDHTSILYLHRRVDVYREYNADFAADLAELFRRCAESEPFARDRLIAAEKEKRARTAAQRKARKAERDKARHASRDMTRAIMRPRDTRRPRNVFAGAPDVAITRAAMVRGSHMLAEAINALIAERTTA